MNFHDVLISPVFWAIFWILRQFIFPVKPKYYIFWHANFAVWPKYYNLRRFNLVVVFSKIIILWVWVSNILWISTKALNLNANLNVSLSSFLYLLLILQLLIPETPFKRCVFVWYLTQRSIKNDHFFSGVAKRQKQNYR